jgi:arylsulfatase A-like enzyme
MDVRVGWILEQLAADGLTDDTVVLFFADNGRLEARGIHWCWDSGLHVPMILHWSKNHTRPPQYAPGTASDQVLSLLDVTATTLWIAGIEKPPGMQSRNFLGERPDPPRTFGFSARDRIDETAVRLRSVHDGTYHYIRNYTRGAGFLTLNRYKEKCFPVKPLMRRLHAQGKLSGPPLDLMRPLPRELLYDISSDPHEIKNLADSNTPKHSEALIRLRAALDTWIVETGDRGHLPEPRGTIAAFEQEMHEWFGTPAWYQTPQN